MLDVVEMRVCTTTKEPHSLYIGVVCVVPTRKCRKVRDSTTQCGVKESRILVRPGWLGESSH